ncbi:MAG: thiamine pyrophosphate-dependent enzyme [Peptococcaceae bacterium]|jgi:2-oxoglutarate ferredoxin oxidoreductase subunit beta|nr:thiamine pyrophosphate-dependent enzyme [Peptococcaceae bacterium]MDH7524719.1 thiamine pyrophosphate-dependent enzyme [Peptococcaceae bacterium]
MAVVFERPRSLTDQRFRYCPGCHHGIIHRLVAEAIDDLEIQDRTIAVASVGCSVFSYEYFDTDAIQAAHGRAPAVATGIKRVEPECVVFTYQGDGDLAAIGTAEIVHAAARGENITVIFVNNAVYGMTSGQMAPTTLIGQVTTTSPDGRIPSRAGYPIRVCELLNTLEGPAYLARVSVHDPRHVREAKKAIKEAFQVQLAGKGFSLVEVLSACPTNWHLSPLEAIEWIKEKMIPYYPLGKFKNVLEVKEDA